MSSGGFGFAAGTRSSGARSSTDQAQSFAGGVPAPYGRACTNCAKAKCRCVYRGSGLGSGDCERCHRLGKQCVPSETVRKRTPRRHMVSRTAQLEEKLDDLVSLLKTQKQAKDGARKEADAGGASLLAAPSSQNARRPPSARGRDWLSSRPPAPAAAEMPSPPSSHGTAESRTRLSAQAANTATASPEDPAPSLPPAPMPTPLDPAACAEAERSLDAFRSRFIRFFPFIHIPVSATAQNLQRTRPMTMMAIRCVTARSFETQQELGDRFRALVAQKAVAEHESSMDILLSTLTYAGWAHLHKRDRPCMTIFTRLATSQVIELGLYRPFGQLSNMRFWKETELKSFMPDHFKGPGPTNEERRAALGCYCLCAMTSSTMRRFEPLKLTFFMEEMLRHLEKNPECEGDKVLVAHVKLEQLIEQIHSSRAAHNSDTMAGPGDPSKGLPSYSVNLLRARLKDIVASLPEELLKHDAIEPVLCSLELMLNECGINKPPRALIPLSLAQEMPEPASSSLAANPQQLEYLYSCADSIERYFDRLFAIPAIFYHGFSFAMCTRLTHALVTLFRLSVFDDPLWDRASLRRRVDVLKVIDDTTAKVMEVKRAAGLDDGSDGPKPSDANQMPSVFAKSLSLVQKMRAAWESELNKLDAATQDSGSGGRAQHEASSSSAAAAAGTRVPGGRAPLMCEAGGQLPQLMMSTMEMQHQPPPQTASFGQFDALTGSMMPLGLTGQPDQGWFADVFYPWDYQTMAMNWANI